MKFERGDLVKLLGERDGLSKSLQSVLMGDVVNKLKSQRRLIKKGVIKNDPISVSKWHAARTQQSKDRFRNVIEALLKGKSVGKEERKRLENYKRVHAVAEEDHWNAVKLAGWTVDEYERGVQAE